MAKRPSQAIGMSRMIHKQPLRKRFVLFTEGEQTEPDYFNAIARLFRVNMDVKGFGESAWSLLDRALAFKNSTKYVREYDNVWIVFDLDRLSPDVFNQIVRTAQAHGVCVAYSIPCFEVWLLLHFDLSTAPMSSQDCSVELARQLGKPYRKNDWRMMGFIAKRDPHAAIRRSTQLKAFHDTQLSNLNPSTTVDRLMEEILKASADQTL